MNDVLNAAIGIAVLALIVSRQLRARPVKEESAVKLILILGAIGILDTINALHSKPHTSVGIMPIVWIIGSLIVAGGLGIARASSVRIWRTAHGRAMSKGTTITMVLWIVALGIHFLFDVGIDHASPIAGLGSATVLLYLAVSLGSQREIVRLRVTKLVPQTVESE